MQLAKSNTYSYRYRSYSRLISSRIWFLEEIDNFILNPNFLFLFGVEPCKLVPWDERAEKVAAIAMKN